MARRICKVGNRRTCIPKYTTKLINRKPGQGAGYVGELPLIPRVDRSVISLAQRDGILVTWDRPMMVTCDIKDQINVIIDGGAPVHPTSVVFDPTDPSKMGIIMATPFKEGQVVTWAYDDQGPCDLQEVRVPNTEADNQTYVVNNQIVVLPISDDFIGACMGNADDMQLQVKGAGIPISKHTSVIYQPDFQGIYTPFNADEPVWRGGRSNRIVGNFNGVNDEIVTDITSPVDSVELSFIFAGGDDRAVVLALPSHNNYINTIDVSLLRQVCVTYLEADGTKKALQFNMSVLNTDTLYTVLVTKSADQLPVCTINNVVYAGIDVGTLSHNNSNAIIGSRGSTFFMGRIFNVIINGINVPIDEGSGTDIHDSDGNVVGTLTATDADAFWSGRVRNEDGKTYTDDYDGNPINPKPLMHYQPEATNVCTVSNNINKWLANGNLATFDQVGLYGVANTASLLTDNSTVLRENYMETFVNALDGATYTTCRIYIKKQSSVTHRATIRSSITGGTATNDVLFVFINLETGVLNIISDTSGGSATVNSIGDWWEVLLYIPNTNSNVSSYIVFEPSGATLTGGADDTLTGSIIVGNVEIYYDKTIEEVKNLGPIFTDDTAVSTDRIDYEYDIANLNNDSGAMLMEIASAPGLIAGTFLSYGLGPELIADPYFNDPTYWHLGGLSTIQNNKCTLTGDNTYNNLIRSQAVVDDIDAHYLFNYVVESIGQNTLYQLSTNAPMPSNVYLNSSVGSNVLNLYGMDGNSLKYLNIQLRGTANSIGETLTFTKLSVVKFEGADFRITDSHSNSISLPGTSNTINRVGIRWSIDEGLMSIMVNDTWSADVPYSGKLADDFKLFTQGFQAAGVNCIRTWSDGHYDELKQAIDNIKAFNGGFDSGFK